MGKKISELTIASTPYEGEELFAMVEDNATVAAPLSSLQTFLSGQDHLASPHKNNNFTVAQTVRANISSFSLNVGINNTVSLGTNASITGGKENKAACCNSTVAGGEANCACGTFSFIGGGL